MNRVLTLVFIIAIVTACNTIAIGREKVTSTPNPFMIVEHPTITPMVSFTPTEMVLPSATSDTRLSPERWKEWPVVPIVQPEMKTVLQRGVELGNNPKAFLKIGDGEISTDWFLTQYDLGPAYYHLGPYTALQAVIKNFSGSFGHIGLAAGRGFNTKIILGPAPAGTPGCNPGDSRLDCELRNFHPCYAIISLGTSQVWEPEVFEPGLRKIINILLKAGVVPILSTKADNLEGNFRINTIIARLAYEYNLPMWNFWLAVQPLPDHGLQADREHLTYANSDFSDPINFQYAWPWRNLTALQVLDSVYQAVTSQP